MKQCSSRSIHWVPISASRLKVSSRDNQVADPQKDWARSQTSCTTRQIKDDDGVWIQDWTKWCASVLRCPIPRRFTKVESCRRGTYVTSS